MFANDPCQLARLRSNYERYHEAEERCRMDAEDPIYLERSREAQERCRMDSNDRRLPLQSGTVPKHLPCVRASVRARGVPVKSCKWCYFVYDVEAFPLRSAACGPCKSRWESIWRSVTRIYIKEGYQWLRQSQLQLYVFNDYKNFVEAGGRGHDFKWGDFIPELYLKSNEEHWRRLPVDAPVAPEPPVPAVPAPGAASASGEVVSPELVVRHHHDDERDECGEIVPVIRRVRRRSM